MPMIAIAAMLSKNPHCIDVLDRENKKPINELIEMITNDVPTADLIGNFSKP